jgi:rare lipoprotein A
MGIATASCAETQLAIYAAKQFKQDQKATEQAAGRYKVGDPYKIDGVYYYPAVDYDYAETGVASWYGPKFHGKQTANGEIYDMNQLTAAHRTLPMPSMVRVVNLDNGRALTLRVNDRGPFARGRIIDVSRRAAQLLGFRYRGTARVKVEILADESRQLAALSGRGEIPESERIAPVPGTDSAKIATAAVAPPGSSAPTPPAKAVNGSPADAPAPTIAEPDGAAASVIEVALEQDVVRPTALYVQAGAFVRYPNAARLRSQLARVAPAEVTEARVGKEKYFRVRLGPFQNLSNADRALAEVAASGYPKARLIVE